MIANYNIALLRSLQAPLEEGLEELRVRLSEGSYRVPSGHEAAAKAGSVDPVLEWSRQIKGNLQMVRCHAVSRVANTLDEAVRGLFDAARRGWTAGRSRQVAVAAANLAAGLKRHIAHMVNEDPVLPVTLWPQWSALNGLLGATVGRPEDLFEPDPQFGEMVFRQTDPAYLASVIEGAIDRLQDALEQWRQAESPIEAERAARRVQEVFDGVYGLKHRRAYQVYWLAWRARLTVGLLEGGVSLLERKSIWATELHETEVELRKFGQGARAPQFQRLMNALAPLVEAQWPDVWSVGHPVLAEIDQCLNLGAFWALAEEVQNPEHQRIRDEYDQHRTELMGAVTGFSTACMQAFGNPTPSAFRALQQAGSALLDKEEWVPDARLSPLFGAVRRLASAQGAGKPWPNPESALELAGMVITLEEALDRPFPMATALVERIQVQLERLQIAWEGRGEALQEMPPIRWDPVYLQQKERQALLKVLQVVRADLEEVETQWVETDRQGEAAAGVGVTALAHQRLDLAARVLATLRLPAGEALARALIDVLGDTRFVLLSPSARANFVSGLASLSTYLEAVAQGQDRPASMLSPLVEWAGDGLAAAVLAEEEGANGAIVGEDAAEDEASPPVLTDDPVTEREEGHEADRSFADIREDLAQWEAIAQFQVLEGDETMHVKDAPPATLDLGSDPLSLTPTSLPSAEPAPEGLDALDDWDVFSSSPEEPAEADSAEEGLAEEAEPMVEDSPVAALEPEALGPVETNLVVDVQPPEPEARPSWLAQPLLPLPSADRLSAEIAGAGVVDRPTDREIAKCFVDEAGDILAGMRAARTRLRAGGEDEEDWAVIRRGFHTLKGSGRMAGYVAFGEVARWCEEAMVARIGACVPFDDDVDHRLERVEEIFSGWAEAFRRHARALVQGNGLQEEIDGLSGPVEPQAPVPLEDPVEDAPLSQEDQDWDEVFGSLQQMIHHAQRLGQALLRVREHRAE